MIALQMTDVKKTMSTLLKSNTFDSFCVQEIQITKDVSMLIDGRIHPDYYTMEQRNDDPSLLSNEFSTYASLRPFVTSFIQGNHTPLAFKFVLQAPGSYLKSMISNPAFTGNPEDIKALILTFRFEHGKLTCLTGTAFQSFSLDKSVDELWDSAICKSFDKIGIPFEKM